MTTSITLEAKGSVSMNRTYHTKEYQKGFAIATPVV